MEGYLWKERYYCTESRKGKARLRYCILDEEEGTVSFKQKKEEVACHKSVHLDEISHVLKFGDHGFLVLFRHVATSEKSGSAFLFKVPVEGIVDDLTQAETRERWVEKLVKNINGKNDGLDLMIRNKESIHSKYKVTFSPSSLLGTGMCGDVRLIERKSDKKPFAMKTISLSGRTGDSLGALRREIDILKSLDHPHIARVHQIFIEPKLYCRLVLDLCQGGELFHRMKTKGHFTERYTAKLITTMLKALNYLHSNLIVHRDLKLENWLFWQPEVSPDDEDADIALVDFGLSRRLRSLDEEMLKQVGTCYYVAPEVLEGRYKGTSCDLWSLGVICFMLISGHAPFESSRDAEITRMVKEDPVPDIYSTSSNSVWAEVSTEGKDFVMKLLEKNPEKRLDTKQALEHPWIVNILNEQHSIHRRPSKTHKVNDSILESLRNFTKYKEFKRLAMECIAFSLDHNEIKNLTDLFEEIDTDNDGYIGLEELVSALKDHDNLDREEITKIFNALDEEQSGRVHVNEFVAGALQARYHLEANFLDEAFSRLDVCDKGEITLEDIQRVLGKCATNERINAIWEQLRGSGDSKKPVTRLEFLQFMRTDGEDKVREFRRASKTPKQDPVGQNMSEVELVQLKLKGSGKPFASSASSSGRSSNIRGGFRRMRNKVFGNRRSGIKPKETST